MILASVSKKIEIFVIWIRFHWNITQHYFFVSNNQHAIIWTNTGQFLLRYCTWANIAKKHSEGQEGQVIFESKLIANFDVINEITRGKMGLI